MTSTVEARKAKAKFYTKRELAELLNCSQKHIERISDRGIFPKPVRLGRMVRWHMAVVDKFLEDQAK